MPRAKRRNQMKRVKRHLKIHFSFQIPTVAWVLVCFSVAVFYVANDHWWLTGIAWLLLIGAAVDWYMNAYGIAKQLHNALSIYQLTANTRVLILNTANSDAVHNEVSHLESLTQLTMVKNHFNHLRFQNGAFDLVIVNYAFQEIRPRLIRIKAMQEAARVVKSNGDICIIEKGFNAGTYVKFLSQSGFKRVKIKNNGSLDWWAGPWRSAFTITGKK